MKNATALLISSLLFALAFSLLPGPSLAQEYQSPAIQNGSDLLAAVNSLRLLNGLPAYSAHPILMQIAQVQADYIAATGGQAGHFGPDGSRPSERARAAGYSAVFFSENWTGGSGLSPSGAVTGWQGDAPHLLTMLSPDLIEAGAGVSKSGNVTYYVLDAGGGSSSGPGSPVTGGTSAPVGTVQPSQFMVSVTLSTPGADGLVYHEVAYGQSLWSIAIAYGTKINAIQSLNNLTGLDIYPGQNLLVARGPIPVPVTVTLAAAETLSALASPTAGLLITPTLSFPTLALPTQPSATVENSVPKGGVSITAILIVSVALFFAALGTWMGTRKPV